MPVLLPSSPPADRRLDHLHQLISLNRLFLHALKRRYSDGLDCLGLPKSARAALAVADDELLDAAACFPRALFSLALPEQAVADSWRAEPMEGQSGIKALKLTLVHSIWNMCLQNEYRARVLLDLSCTAMARLRAMSLFELPQAAADSSLSVCRFRGADWLWTTLLSLSDGPTRERLGLVMLQPQPEAPPSSKLALRRTVTA